VDERGKIDGNLALARWSYELWNSGGVEASVEHVWAHDIVFHEIPASPDAGVYSGIETFAAHAREIVDLGGHFQIDVRSLEGHGSWVLASLGQNFKGRTGGVAMTGSTFHLARWEGGRVVDLRAFTDEAEARREYERLAAAPSS